MFLINIVLGGLGFVAALKVLPETPARPTVRLDGPGAVLLGLAMLAATLGLIDGAS